MAAYYNEIDRFAAAWLRELMKAGNLPYGEVDERRIENVQPSDLRGFRQCHFFAGIGVWAYALRQAGWPDDTPVWTGSCPCQGFSASGKRGGFSDQRHLWPAWFRLIRELRPQHVFGEQVASKDGLAWLDLVSADLEGAGYAIGAADTCAAGFGAPHIRQRLYFVAESDSGRASAVRRGDADHRGESVEESWAENYSSVPLRNSTDGELAHADEPRRARAQQHDGGSSLLPARSQQFRTDGELAHAECSGLRGRRPSEAGGEPGAVERSAGFRAVGELGDATDARFQGNRSKDVQGERNEQLAESGNSGSVADSQGAGSSHRGPGRLLNELGGGEREVSGVADSEHSRGRRTGEAGDEPGAVERFAGLRSTNGFWADAEWLYCRDGKYRPVEPGTFPLAHESAARVGRLRGYGNALCAPQAIAFIEAYMEDFG